MNGYLGEVRMFAGNFAPEKWMFCEGQALPITNNESLYALLGTEFGGDGMTTFGLPDFRGRAPYGTGNGHNLLTAWLGEHGFVDAMPDQDQNLMMRGTIGINFIICVDGDFPARAQ